MSGRPDGAAILAETKSRRRRARIYQILGLVAVAAIVAGVMVWRTKSKSRKGVRYRTATVQLGDLKETVTATGTLKGLDSVVERKNLGPGGGVDATFGQQAHCLLQFVLG